jgi:glycosyltransferase involved in cell wall biosynthesis
VNGAQNGGRGRVSNDYFDYLYGHKNFKEMKNQKEMKRINVCSVGDPTSPDTWSGTPFNLCRELQKIDCLADAFSSMATPNKYGGKLLSLGWKYSKKMAGGDRGFLSRYLNSERVKKLTEGSSSPLTLHAGTLDLPFWRVPKGQKHYLFCDSTWNLWSSCSTQRQGYTHRFLKNAERLERKAYEQMEHIFTISEYVRENMIDHYGINPQKISVVGTGLGVVEPYFGAKDYSNNKILFAAKGRFEDKGGSLVLRAFERAAQVYPDMELIIVGQNEYTKLLKGKNIRVYGFIPVEELQRLFNECSLFLMPAINEPWGLVYLEALACKMPIVGLNRNSFPEISQNGKYGFGLEGDDPEKLSEILIDAFADTKNLERMGQAGQEFCLEKFSWDKTVARIMSVI